MTWSSLGMQLAEMILPVIAAALVALIGYGVAYLREKTSELQNAVARDALDSALVEAEVVAKDAIRATNQVLVDALKERSADGKLTKDEAIEAMTRAVEYFVEHISRDSLRVLQASLGPIEGWLSSFLEAKVSETKLERRLIELSNPT